MREGLDRSQFSFSIRRLSFFLFSFSLFLISGCNLLGVAAQALPPSTEAAAYQKLDGQTVGVIVWADHGVRIDWSTIQLDIATAVQNKLVKAPPKELKDVQFPVKPASIVRFQQDHPELDGAPITEVAPKLGVSRLIYIEVEQFATRSDQSVDLYRGTLAATVKVVEIDAGIAKIGFEENRVSAHFPRKSPQEGVPGAGDYRIYVGTVDAFATQVANRFLAHEDEN